MKKETFIHFLRFQARNKTSFLINLFVLCVGLTIFLFTQILTDYEETHDAFFKDSDRIFAVTTELSANSKYQVPRIYSSPVGIAGLAKTNVPEIEKLTRYFEKQYNFSVENRKFAEFPKFVDPAFFEIFNLTFLSGGAPKGPNEVILTETAAEKYFGAGNPVGKTLRIAGAQDLRVAGVFQDLPLNSHFVYRMGIQERPQIILPVSVLEKLEGPQATENWDINFNSRIYALVADPALVPGVDQKLSGLIGRYAPTETQEDVVALDLVPLTKMNEGFWDAGGLSLIAVMEGFGLLILLVSVLNYLNLGTAQIMKRTKMISLERILGAERLHIFFQFFMETVFFLIIALAVAVAILLVIVPVFNDLALTAMSFSYLFSPAFLLKLAGLVAGLAAVAGFYPFFISKKIMSGQKLKFEGAKSFWMRRLLVFSQFSISTFLVLIMSASIFQTQYLDKIDLGMDKNNVLVINNFGQAEVLDRYDVLKSEIANIPGVKSVSGTFPLPLNESFVSDSFSLTDNAGDAQTLNLQNVDYGFFDALKIPLVSGREFSRTFSSDIYPGRDQIQGPEPKAINIVINQTAAERLGFKAPEDALGKILYPGSESAGQVSYTIVGVVRDANLFGITGRVNPTIFRLAPPAFTDLLIKTDGADFAATTAQVKAVWDNLFPTVPFTTETLDDVFYTKVKVFQGLNKIISGLSFWAVLIASVSLYGMVSYLTFRREKEIAIRKVMGGNRWDMIRFILWDFLKPVVVSLVLFFPLGALAAQQYLNIFPDRFDGTYLIYVLASVMIILFTGGTVFGHTLKASGAKPAIALSRE